jgi:hypothetical protein
MAEQLSKSRTKIPKALRQPHHSNHSDSYYFPGKLQHKLRNGLGENLAYQHHSQMTFLQLQESQRLFERGLVGTDGALVDLDEPAYLLERGIIGEAHEAIEALHTIGHESDSFRDEMIDIVVFISALFNHVGIRRKTFYALLAQASWVDESDYSSSRLGEKSGDLVNQDEALKEKVTRLLKHHVIDTSMQALSSLQLLGPASPEFRQQVMQVLMAVVEIFAVLNVSDLELRNRTARKVFVNFGKYRPEDMQGKTVKEGLKTSRNNFTRSMPTKSNSLTNQVAEMPILLENTELVG